LPQIPTAFVYLAWFPDGRGGVLFPGNRNPGKSIEQIDKELAAGIA